jgi:hypothetical protein
MKYHMDLMQGLILKLLAFSLSVLDEGEWSASCFQSLYPRYPLDPSRGSRSRSVHNGGKETSPYPSRESNSGRPTRNQSYESVVVCVCHESMKDPNLFKIIIIIIIIIIIFPEDDVDGRSVVRSSVVGAAAGRVCWRGSSPSFTLARLSIVSCRAEVHHGACRATGQLVQPAVRCPRSVACFSTRIKLISYRSVEVNLSTRSREWSGTPGKCLLNEV